MDFFFSRIYKKTSPLIIKFILLPVALLVTFNLAAQVSPEQKQFLLDFYNSETTKGKTFIYSQIHKFDLEQSIKDLKTGNDTLRNRQRINDKFQTVDSLILTKDEKQYLINELEKQTNISLDNIHFENF